MAGNQRLQYTIGVNADTTQFKQDVQQAIQSLQTVGLNNQITPELKAASQAALELQANLARALNQNTGKLDLLTFSKNLKQSGQTLDAYYNQITKLGPAGEQAFLKVAQAITQSELPLKRSNKLMSDLWTTMKNTMRWQITSGALNIFTGALQTAYGYSKDLDRSLNSIRIITNKNIDDMKEFASQANNAAKALSTTTVDYTDASLIYYQQGLNDQQVKERTDTTIKLANVSNQVAENVSSQMTAIWQNFYDGSKSLEYYSDVIVALGATTASSSDQIAQGVQKFAPIAQTVGLSYEYAASALATLVANTQQSADIVGTSLRTLFSRLQGLKLGETFDDGTDLNKYSQALNAVGINIKDTTGGLKDMDTILDETAAKWNSLSKDQQMALAQTVAGVRQYTSFVALMDSWGDFQKNLNTALGSEGTLQKQANIYAESWEAARDRVRASAEDIYDSLINPSLYIGMDNVLSPVLDTIADMIDGLGGLPGVLTLVGNLMLFAFGDKMASSMRDMADNISIITGHESKHLQLMKEESLAYLEEQRIINEGNTIFLQKLDLIQKQTEASIEESKILEKMTESEREATEPLRMNLQLMQQSAEAAIQRAEAVKESADDYEEILRDQVYFEDSPQNINKEDLAKKFGVSSYKTDFEIRAIGFEQTKEQFKEIIELQEKLRTFTKAYNTELKGTSLDAQRKYAQSLGLTDQQITEILKHSEQMTNANRLLQSSNNNLTATEEIFTRELGLTSDQVEKLEKLLRKLARENIKSGQAVNQAIDANDAYLEKLKQIQNEAPKVSEQIVTIARSLMAVQSFNNAFNSIADTFTDDSLSGLEKFNKFLGSLIAILPIYLNLLKDVNLQSMITSVKNSFLVGSNTAVATSGVAAGAGMSSLAGGIAAVGTSIKTALPIIGLIIAAISLVTNIISTVTKKLEENKQAIRDTAYEIANAKKEEVENNKKLISSMQEALIAYKENGENKEELNNVTQSLAEAYHLEGSALAKLTGRYEDYNKVLEKAKEKQLQEQRRQLSDTITAKNFAEEEILSTARKGSGYTLGGSTYSIEFSGWGNEQKEQDILKQVVSGYSNEGWLGAVFSVSADAKSLVQLYDELTKAKELIASRLTNVELSNSGTYADITDWLDKMSTVVENYKQYSQQIEILNIQTSQSDLKVSSLTEYSQWLDNTTELLKEAGYDGEELQKILSTIVDTSLNPDISGFKDIYDAINEIKNIVDDSKFTGNLEELFTSKDFEPTILANINWSLVTDDNFESLYENAKKYTEAVNNIIDAQAKLAGAESALDIIEKAKGNLDAETLTSLSHAIDWGNEEQNIIKFSEFLKLTQQEQITYLNKMISNSYELTKEGLNSQIEEIEAQIKTHEEFLAQVDEEELKRQEYNLAQAQALQQAYNTYQNSEDKENFDIDKFNLDETQIIVFNAIKNQLPDQVKESLEEGVNDANAVIQPVIDAKNAISSLQDELEDTIFKAKIQIQINFKKELEDIEGSTDSIVNIFDTISKGIEETTNDMGQKVYGLSLEAVQAIDALYPDFMQNATMLKDGTFALTEEMAQAFFGMEDGILAKDTNTRVGILRNLINELEFKKQQNNIAIEEAQKVANGEIDIEEALTDDKSTLLTQFVAAQETANGESLEDTVETLQDQDSAHEKLSEVISGYSADASVNMTNNMSSATGLILNQLDQIRDGAYKTYKQVSAIGSDIEINEDDFKFDTNAKGSADSIDWFTDIDTTSSETFLAGLIKAVPKTVEELQAIINASNGEIETMREAHSRAIGAALVKYYEDANTLIDRQQDAATVAISKLLTSIDGAYDKLTKASEGSGGRNQKFGERYHDINRLLEQQEETLDNIDESMDRVYGADRLALYTKKQAELSNQLDLYKQKLDEIEQYDEEGNLSGGYLYTDKEALKNHFGLKKEDFDEYGNIIDEEALEKRLVAAYNTGDEYLQEWSDKGYELIKQYEETVDLSHELKDNMVGVKRTIEDIKLDKINRALEIKLDQKSLKDNLRDWRKALVEANSDALFQAPELASIAKEQYQADVDIIDDYITKYNELATMQLQGTYDITDFNTLREQMADLQEDFISAGEDILEYIDVMENLLPNAIAAAAERFTQFTEQLDHNVSVLGAVKELLALQGVTYKTADGFEQLTDILESQLKSQSIAAELNKKQYDKYREELAWAEANLANDFEGSVTYDKNKKARDAILEQYNASLEAMLQSAQDTMNTAKEIFTLAIEQASYEFENVMSKGLSFDLMQDQFDHYIEEEERYFDQVNTLYEQNAWKSKLQQDIDSTTNKVYIDRLKALQDEIDMRSENNTLSQYDLDILNAKYNLTKAQMELEDAQNAKNNLRLVRDRQGNWNYQYTADQGAIDKAKDEVAKAQNEWYNIAKKQTKAMTSEILKTYQDFNKAVQDVYNDQVLSDEAKAEKLIEIEEFYTQKIEFLENEKNIAVKDMTEAGKLTIKDFSNVYAEDLNKLDGDTEKFKKYAEDYLGSCDEAFNKYAETVDREAGNIDMALGDEGLNQVLKDINESNEKIQASGTKLIDDIHNRIGEITEITDEFNEMANALGGLVEKLQLADEYINHSTDLGLSMTGDYNSDYDYSALMAYAWTQGGTDAHGYTTFSKYRDEKIKQEGIDPAVSTKELLDYFSWDTTKDKSESDAMAHALISNYAASRGMKYEEALKELQEIYNEYERKWGFDTGGYTGEFTNGRLAILHEKELVLNQEDTSNILTAVAGIRALGPEIFRAIEAILDGNAMATMGVLGSQLNGDIGRLPQLEGFEQNVHIEAVFPNAIDRNEIEEAFRTLNNDAAQWARRKRD